MMLSHQTYIDVLNRDTQFVGDGELQCGNVICQIPYPCCRGQANLAEHWMNGVRIGRVDDLCCCPHHPIPQERYVVALRPLISLSFGDGIAPPSPELYLPSARG